MFVHHRYRFRPRVLRNASKVNLQVQLQGEWVESPVGVAPTSLHKMAHEDGEIATAQGKSRIKIKIHPVCVCVCGCGCVGGWVSEWCVCARDSKSKGQGIWDHDLYFQGPLFVIQWNLVNPDLVKPKPL